MLDTTQLVIHVETEKQVDDAIIFLSKLDWISLDTETTGTDPLVNKVLLISAGNPHRQYVFDVAKIEAFLPKLKPVLEQQRVILHNAKFDYKFLKQQTNITLENVFDTMLAEQLLLKGRKMQGFGLDDVADKYLGIKLNKDIRQTFLEVKYGDAMTADQILYSGIDVQYLELIYRKQYELLKKYNLLQAAEIEMQAVLPTGDMELNGMYLSPAKWSKAETAAIAERLTAQEELDKLFGPVVGTDMFNHAEINYRSPKQLIPALKKILGKRASDLNSTKESDLKDLLNTGIYDRLEKEGLALLPKLTDVGDKVIAALLIYREKEKRISTYGLSFLENIHPKTGRIHSSFSQLYTDTGRYSSSDPNLQNIPREKQYRDAFTAWHPDYKIIGCDYSGMELRILADLTQEPFWIDVLKRGGDLHSEIGSLLYNKPIRKKGTNGPDDPGENWELRQPVKSLNFGVGYGMGPQKLAGATGMAYDKAKELIKTFWTKFPRIKGYFDAHVKASVTAKCVKSPYDGRLRWLDGFDYDSQKDQARIRNMCMNFPMQSGNASITKHALYLIRQHLKGKDAKIISTVHDEILVEAHKDIAQEVYDIVRKDMIDAAKRFIKNVPVDVEGHISDQWEK